MTPTDLRAEAKELATRIWVLVKCSHPSGTEITDALIAFAQRHGALERLEGAIAALVCVGESSWNETRRQIRVHVDVSAEISKLRAELTALRDKEAG